MFCFILALFKFGIKHTFPVEINSTGTEHGDGGEEEMS